MDIYAVLASKPHNPHYLNRYIKFIESCQSKNITRDITNKKFEIHHICPKAKDLFPEYKSFKLYPWNAVNLTLREHFIAHWILSKCYGKSQIYAFWSMVTKQSRKSAIRDGYKITSRLYEHAKLEYKLYHGPKVKGRKNKKAADIKRNMVSCYDSEGNYHFIPKEIFDIRDDLFGVNKGRKLPEKSKEYINYLTLDRKDRKWMYNPNDINSKNIFVKPEDIQKYLDAGFIFMFTNTYDRKKYSKNCPHCNRNIDPTNYKRWHGDKCKMKSF